MADKPNVNLIYKTIADIIARRESVQISITVESKDGSEPPYHYITK